MRRHGFSWSKFQTSLQAAAANGQLIGINNAGFSPFTGLNCLSVAVAFLTALRRTHGFSYCVGGTKIMPLKKFVIVLTLAGAAALSAGSASAFWGGSWMPWNWFDDDYYYRPWGGYPGYGWGGYPGYGYGGYPGYGWGGYPGYGWGGYPGYGYGGGYPGYGWGGYPGWW